MALEFDMRPGTCCSRAITPSCTAAPGSRTHQRRRLPATCCGCGSRFPTAARFRPTTPTPGSTLRRTGNECPAGSTLRENRQGRRKPVDQAPFSTGLRSRDTHLGPIDSINLSTCEFRENANIDAGAPAPASNEPSQSEHCLCSARRHQTNRSDSTGREQESVNRHPSSARTSFVECSTPRWTA